MRMTTSKLALFIALALPCLTCSRASGMELLTNGDFETIIVSELSGWDLDEFVTGDPGATINTAEPRPFANHPEVLPDELGLWLRSFTGSESALTNAVLSQTVSATPGETYTFTGNSLFQQNYPGGVETLDPLAPAGAIPSPTETTFSIEFLDGGGAAIGSPTVLDLTTEQLNGLGWTIAPHSLSVVAPAGAVDVRVAVSATDMIANVDPEQSAFVDNFSLTAGSAPTTELLTNADLNEPTVTVYPGWELTEPDGVDNLAIQNAGWANNTPDGSVGAWFKQFTGGDASVSQTVDATAGTEYVLSAWTRWEANYSGGIVDSGTETTLEIAFLDSSEEVIGAPEVLDLRTEQMNDNTWREHSLSAVAPAGTVSAVVTGAAIGMVVATGGGLSAFFDDFSLTVAPAGLTGDYNNDGTVDAADYTVWRDNLGTTAVLLNDPVGGTIGPDQYNNWRDNFGEFSALTSAAESVPEPAAAWLVLTGLGGFAVRRRVGG